MNQGDRVRLEVAAQRHLRSPIDTLLQVFDEAGQLVAENDDGEMFQGECTHDFVPFDSYLVFTAKKQGDYFVCVREQSGFSGPGAAYQLTVEDDSPDFKLFQWPDAVPVWGPGVTSAFVVETHRLGGLDADIELSVEGLPDGWTGSVTSAISRDYRPPRGAFGHKSFLTITAPQDAPIGAVATFHVVGRARVGDRLIERRAQPLTQYLWSEPNRFRYSPIARAVVAPPTGLRLESPVSQVKAAQGEEVSVPIRIDAASGGAAGKFTLSVNEAKSHFKCSLGVPVTVSAEQGQAAVEIPLAADFPPGPHWILISDSWASETRKGLPGPCTRLIRLDVSPRGK
jgi:hypothetical protein